MGMRRLRGILFLLCLPALAQVSISPPTLVPGILGSSYLTTQNSSGLASFTGFAFQASGGTAPYTWGLGGGSLPPGMSILPNGRLLGIPAAEGSFDFTVRVVDSASRSATRDYTLAVGPRIQATWNGRVGNTAQVNHTCTSLSGATFTFLISSGSLPPGITLNTRNGNYGGVPTLEGMFHYQWQCASTAFTLTFDETFVVGPPQQFSLRNGVVGQAYDRPIVFDSSFATPIQNAVVEGALPPGLGINNPLAPTVSGTPTAPGLYLFAVRFTSAAGMVSTRRYVIYIGNTPTIQLSLSQIEFSSLSDGALDEQRVGVQTNSPGLRFSTQVLTESGGDWLKVSSTNPALPAGLDIQADPTGLAPATYKGRIVVSADPPVEPQVLAVSFNVAPGAPPKPAFGAAWIGLLNPSGGSPVTRQIRIFNRGSGSFTFRSNTVTRDGSPWLALSPPEGTVTAKTPLTAFVTADPTALPPGVYPGRILLSGGDAGNDDLRVTLAVTPSGPQIQLSQTGLVFRSSAPSNEQELWIANSGTGVLNWQAAPAAGAPWLKLSAASGVSTAGNRGSRILASVDPGSLDPGVYDGQIRVSGADAPNSPQTVLVRMIVPRSDQQVVNVSPLGMLFDASGQQDVVLQNLGAAVSYTAQAVFPSGDEWFRVDPISGSLGRGAVRRLTIRASNAELKPGIYPARLLVRWGDAPDASAEIQLLLVIPGSGNSAFSSANPRPDSANPALSPREPPAAGCAPTQLVPLFTTLAANFPAAVGWPVPLEVLVVDSCGQRLTGGSVTVSFSNGDPALPMRSQSDGRWTGTWTPRRVNDNMTVTVRALWPEQKLEGTAKIGGSLQGQVAGTPWIKDDGIVSSITLDPQGLLAPGSLFSVLGESLSTADGAAAALPLPADLGGTRVLVAGREIPLRAAGSKKVDGILPYDLPVNLTHQVIVLRGTQISVPETLTLASSQPAIFSMDGSGKGQGQVEFLLEDGSRTLANDQTPARAGMTVLITAAGLGLTNPPVNAGEAPPDSPPASVVLPVKVRFGDILADAAKAELVPARPGVYLVTVSIPDGVPSGSAIPVTLAVDGQESPPVTMTIQ